LAILFLFSVVWATDILAYFVGRAIGGPKLAASISPNKTWSGAVGGTIAAVVAGLVIISAFGGTATVALGLIALVLSIVSQGGDLFESRLKRVCDVKDSSALIPGHGGVMDRLDGFIVAAAAAVLIGVVRAGESAPAHGLIAW
jgi:phosphatidate cytidylyltransferase